MSRFSPLYPDYNRTTSKTVDMRMAETLPSKVIGGCLYNTITSAAPFSPKNNLMIAVNMPSTEQATSDFNNEGNTPPYDHPENTPLLTPMSFPINEGGVSENFLYIVQNCKAIKNEYVIDTSLVVKEECLPPLEDKLGENKNFYLRNDHEDGTVDVELLIKGRRATSGAHYPKRRTRICVSAQGSVTVKIVRCIRFAFGNGRLI